MRATHLLLIALLAAALVVAAADSSIQKLKAKVENGTATAPCDKKAAKGPEPPRQYLDQRLPIVVADYHPPAGGFNPTDIPDKEVDVAARKILREIQKAEAEAIANGQAPPSSGPPAAEIATEEHKIMKQLLLDADILVRAAGKMLAENGPVEEKKVKKIVKKVVKSAVKKAAKAIKKQNKKARKAARKAKKQLAKAPAAPVAGKTAPQKKSRKSKKKKNKKKKKKAVPAAPAAPAAAPAS